MAETPTPAAAPSVAAASVCNGKYKGIKPSPAELAEILKKHAAWLGADDQLADDPRRANLCGADLADANLTDADLDRADLYGANLLLAPLERANLFFAHLERAELSGANLTDANLTGANLTGADLDGANLTYANLTGTDLTGARLTGANLTGANLREARVSKANLAFVDLTGATYAPVSEPPDPYVAGIKGLATLDAYSDVVGLVQLRKLLHDAGLSDSERETTFSIQRYITRDQLSGQSPRSARIEGILRIVGLEWTTAYGLHPERALRWILLLGAVLTPVYMFAMLRPTAASGVVRVFPADRLEGTAGDPADEEKRKKQLIHAQGWRAALRTAAYFSLISAVNIGFEDFTPGDWIRRLQTREYSLEAVGWVRVVAGTQALLSVYLLAMWVLTQFGQPFE